MTATPPPDDNSAPTATSILKAAVFSEQSNAFSPGDTGAQTFTQAGALEPPYQPETLLRLWEISNSLRPCVDAYATNIDGYGHTFEPVIDLDDEDSDARIAQAIAEERAAEGNPGELPTSEEVAAAKKAMIVQMRAERARLARFFDEVGGDEPWVELRKKLRTDLEVIGSGFLEVMRDGNGHPSEFAYLPAFSVRLMPLDTRPVEVDEPRRISEVTYGKRKRRRFFRRFVQIVETRTIFFKEYGDPRIMSAKRGTFHDTLDDLRRGDASDFPATEVLHFRIHSPRTPYGIPRWIGALLAVLGSRQAAEVNADYFDNKSVPPLAVLVSGGTLTADSVKRLESHIEKNVRGRANFHKILIVEAEAASASGAIGDAGSGTVRLDLKPLMDAQQKDALFLQYDERNVDTVGAAFRLPRIVRGDIRDFNRATADAALEFTEEQVFQPEREGFDAIINRRILPALGIRFWRFKSLGPDLNDPTALAETIAKLVLANVITPGEARELSERVFGRALKNLDAAWTAQPVPLTLAGIPGDAGAAGPYTGDDPQPADPRAPFDDLDGDGASDAPGLASGGGDKLASTVARSVLTVNEARALIGLGPLTDASGAPDPRGEVTVAEHEARAKATAAPGRIMGRAPGGPGIGLYGLIADGGASLAQGAPFGPGKGPKQASAAATVLDLVQLRHALKQGTREGLRLKLAAQRRREAAGLAENGTDEIPIE